MSVKEEEYFTSKSLKVKFKTHKTKIKPKINVNKIFAPSSSFVQKKDIKYIKNRDEKFIVRKSNPKINHAPLI